MTMKIRRSCILVGSLLCCTAAAAQDVTRAMAPAWPDTYASRVEALALLQTLNSELLSHESATATLERWCADHGLASPARIVAELQPVSEKPPTVEQRRDLDVTATEPVRYRRVRLRCGPLVLSEAENWYVPGRLTPDMNRVLDATDTPFGKAVQPLHFQRHTLTSRLLWSPLPDGWEMKAVAPAGPNDLAIPPHLLEHRAVLLLGNGTPISEVVETYTSNLLAFPPPDHPHEPSADGRHLIGAWRLAATEYRGPHGETTDPFYQEGSTGIIIYDASGWMSVQIGGPGRRGAPATEVRLPRSTDGDALKAQAYDSYYSYYGTWEYDASTSTVIHHLHSSLVPGEAGMSYAQVATLEGGRLVFTGRSGEAGHETVRRKVWERLTPAARQP